VCSAVLVCLCQPSRRVGPGGRAAGRIQGLHGQELPDAAGTSSRPPARPSCRLRDRCFLRLCPICCLSCSSAGISFLTFSQFSALLFRQPSSWEEKRAGEELFPCTFSPVPCTSSPVPCTSPPVPCTSPPVPCTSSPVRWAAPVRCRRPSLILTPSSALSARRHLRCAGRSAVLRAVRGVGAFQSPRT
jgi:hypothetical protein